MRPLPWSRLGPTSIQAGSPERGQLTSTRKLTQINCAARRTNEQSPPSAEERSSGNDEGGGQRNYAHAYSEEALWKKIAAFAGKAGEQVIEKVLTLYYCLRDSDTPTRARATIAAALGYFIFPMDAIPDMIPGAGFSDDLGALAVALAVVAAHIKDEHKERAKEVLKTWFG